MPLERNYLLLDRYKILEILGQGGMGSVYRANDENLSVEVALKENLFSTEEYNRQFRREATILAMLRHPNLPRVSDHFEIEDQGQYLVMDYIEGEDLRQRMDRVGIIPDEEVIVIGASICEALAYLHSRKPSILHRDIKPGNIKISPNGDVYLVHFGLAKIVEGSQATTTGARAMTPGYSSPEQYGTARTDERSDVYSLGATLYAALTGTIPEDGLARAMEQTDLTPPRARNPKISRKLAGVIEQALAIHPEDRYQTAEEFKKALLAASGSTRRRGEGGEMTITPPPEEVVEAIAEGRASKARPAAEPEINMSGESTARRKRKRQQRLQRIIGGVIVALLLLAVGAIYMVGPDGIAGLGGSGGTEPSRLTQTNAALALIDATSTPDLAATEAAQVAPTETFVPISTPMGGGFGQIAFVSDRSGVPQIYLIDADGSQVARITDLGGGACQPDWSPDGTKLVFISPCRENLQVYPNSSLQVINADGTGLSTLNTPIGSFDPDWSPDGETLLFALAADTNRVEINRYDLESETVEALTANGKLNYQPSWSNDGESLVFVSTLNGGLRLYIMDNELGAESQLFTRSGQKDNTHPSWSPNGRLVVFSQKESGIVPNIFVVSLDMLGVPSSDYRESRLTSGQIVPEQEPDFSPDGLWVAFESWPDGENHDIYVIAAGGGTQQIRLTTDPALDFDPVWRPIRPPSQ